MTINDKGENSSQLEEAKGGEILMTRRALISDDNELAQRKKIFKTRCKCEGKDCNVIIDNVSTNNLVLEEMVKKLKLEKKKYPNPYLIA